MKAYTLSLAKVDNKAIWPKLSQGVWVDCFPNKHRPGTTYTGIYLGHYALKFKNDCGRPVPKYLTIKTIDTDTSANGIKVNNLINEPSVDTDNNRLHLVQCAPQPTDKDIFVLIHLKTNSTGVIDNKVYFDSGRLVQGKEYIDYNPNAPYSEAALSRTATVTAMVLRQNECCTVKAVINNSPVMLTVSNACGRATLAAVDIHSGEQFI